MSLNPDWGRHMTYQTQRHSPIKWAWRGLCRLGRAVAGGRSTAVTRRRLLASVVATLMALLGAQVVTAQPAAAAVTNYFIWNNSNGLWLTNWGAWWSEAPLGEEYFSERDNNARWGLQYLGMGYYNVINSVTNMCMTATSPNTPGSAVVQRTCSGGAGQSWLVSNVRGNGLYEFRYSNNGPCLDVEAPFLRGSDAVMNPCNGSSHQGWGLERA